MKAAVYQKTKSGKVLEIVDLPTPIPKDNEVLIRTRAASVNPLDWRLKSRHPGVDIAGEVVALGKSAMRFKPGDAVFGASSGAFAEYACAAEATLFSKPDRISFQQAASLPVAALTALQALRDKGRLRAAQNVLINGAAGGVGTFAVQIARSMGAEVTAVCSAGNAELARSLGAAVVIDYASEDFTLAARSYDLLLDNVGNRSFSALSRILKPRGRCVLVGVPKQLPAVLARLAKAFLRPPFLRQKFTFFVAKLRTGDLAAMCTWWKPDESRP